VVSLSSIGVFLLAALGLLLMPGPAVIYIVTRSVAQGRRAGLASVAGIELASLCHAAAAALGLSVILVTSALAFNIVKYAGAAYLIYLGIRTAISKGPVRVETATEAASWHQLFGKGFLVNILNPKTALFFYAFLPQFVDPRRGSAVLQIAILGLLFVGLATVTDSAYALVASSVRHLVAPRSGFEKIKRYVTAGIYVALGVAAAATGHGKG